MKKKLGKRQSITLFFFIVFSCYVSGQEILPFQAGENLRYVMHFGWVDGGEAMLSLGSEKFDGKEAWRAKAVAKTLDWVEKFYKVYDVYESVFDPNTLLPYMAIRNIHEDRYRSYSESFFYHQKDTVFSKKTGWQKIPPPCFDIISAFYYLRVILLQKEKPENTILINTYFDDEVFPLRLKYKGIEKIKTRAGTFECLKFLPLVQTGRVFKEEDDLSLWISNDKNLIPVRMQLDMIVGSLQLDLVSYSNVKFPLTSKKD